VPSDRDDADRAAIRRWNRYSVKAPEVVTFRSFATAYSVNQCCRRTFGESERSFPVGIGYSVNAPLVVNFATLFRCIRRTTGCRRAGADFFRHAVGVGIVYSTMGPPPGWNSPSPSVYGRRCSDTAGVGKVRVVLQAYNGGWR